MSEIELLYWERGKTWRVMTPFVVTNRDGHRLTILKGFRHDRYTFAPDLLDEKPAVAHDFAYDYRNGRVWDDGTGISREAADLLLYDLMHKSPDETTRHCAEQYYTWVRRLGGPVWLWGSVKMWMNRPETGRP